VGNIVVNSFAAGMFLRWRSRIVVDAQDNMVRIGGILLHGDEVCAKSKKRPGLRAARRQPEGTPRNLFDRITSVVALRSRRLEQIFGAPLDAVAGAHVHGLVTARAPEMFDLEFKEAHYGRSDSEKRKLAGDVAAMANAAGGVILIGIAEDEQGCAAAAPGVDYTEAEKLQIQQVVAAGISPVPTFDVKMIPDDLAVQSSEDASRDLGTELRAQHGFILIAVLRTTSERASRRIDRRKIAISGTERHHNTLPIAA